MGLAVLFLVTATCAWAAQEAPVKALDTPAVKTKIPARPYMPISADGADLTEPAERGILELTMDYLTLD